MREMNILGKNKDRVYFYIVFIILLIFYVLISYLNPTNFHELNKVNTFSEYKPFHSNLVKHGSILNNTSQNEIIKLKKRYYAFDGNRFGLINRKITQCSNEIEIEITRDLNKANFGYYLNWIPTNRTNKDVSNNRLFNMVYGMESEPFSRGGQSWSNADFRMWYDLDLSFPEPATYFDIKSFLPDLLSKPIVDFEHKETSASLVWVLSNCATFNGREKYVEKLMNLIHVDSYGACLKNKNAHTNVKMKGNIELYSKYKFVIAIENSNCKDYVTEKLIHAVASGSIPIVAGKNGKPDYLRFMPKNSYINIYDFKSIEEFVLHIKKIMTNKKLYEKYIYFKRNHNYTKKFMLTLKLDKLIDLAKTIIDPKENRPFYDGIVTKEKSEDKLCKIARYIENNPRDMLLHQIEEKRMNRPREKEACLPSKNLANDFYV
jgi:hypothetical protein